MNTYTCFRRRKLHSRHQAESAAFTWLYKAEIAGADIAEHAIAHVLTGCQAFAERGLDERDN